MLGVHQGSFSAHCYSSSSCWRLFLEEFRKRLPMELLYADDLVLIAETEELLLEKLKEMEEGDKNEESRSDMLVMWCKVSKGQFEYSGVQPFGVCRIRN